MIGTGIAVASFGLGLIVIGALLVIAGVIGLALSRNKAVAEHGPADESTAEVRPKMPPLPALLDSNRKRRDDSSEETQARGDDDAGR